MDRVFFYAKNVPAAELSAFFKKTEGYKQILSEEAVSKESKAAKAVSKKTGAKGLKQRRKIAARKWIPMS